MIMATTCRNAATRLPQPRGVMSPRRVEQAAAVAAARVRSCAPVLLPRRPGVAGDEPPCEQGGEEPEEAEAYRRRYGQAEHAEHVTQGERPGLRTRGR